MRFFLLLPLMHFGTAFHKNLKTNCWLLKFEATRLGPSCVWTCAREGEHAGGGESYFCESQVRF